MSIIQPSEAKQLLENGAEAVDVRQPREFASGHLPGAINLPLDQLAEIASVMFPNREYGLVIYCASGVRSARAVEWLKAHGWRNVWDMGSLSAWPYGIEHA